MKCEEYRLRLSAWSDGELAKEKESGLKDHLDHCPSCREEEKRLKKIKALLAAGFTPSEPSVFFETRLMQRIREERIVPDFSGFYLRRWVPALFLFAVLLGGFFSVLKVPSDSGADVYHLDPLASSAGYTQEDQEFEDRKSTRLNSSHRL